jgi:hypothetical protein
MGVVVLLGFVAIVLWAVLHKRPSFAARARPPRAIELGSAPGLDRDAMARASSALGELGFAPLLTFELPHQQSDVVRVYYDAFVSPDRERLATVNARISSGNCAVHVFFTTWFDDGKSLVTSNSTAQHGGLDPDIVRIWRSREWDLRRVLAAHDERRVAMKAEGRGVVALDDAETLSALLQRMHEREVAFALKGGLFRLEGDRIVRTFAGDIYILQTLLTPFAQGRSLLWHIGLTFIVALTAVAAAFGTPFFSGVGLGLFTGFTMGLRGVLWLAVTALLSRAAGGDASAMNNLITGFFAGWAAGFSAREGAGRMGFGKSSSLTRRRLGLAAAGLVAMTCAAESVMIAAGKEVHVLPAGYRGAVVISYGQAGAVSARKGRFRVEYDVPASGILAVGDSFQGPNHAFHRFSFHLGSENSRPLRLERPIYSIDPSEIRVCRPQVTSRGNRTLFAYFVGDAAACNTAEPAIQEQLNRAITTS